MFVMMTITPLLGIVIACFDFYHNVTIDISIHSSFFYIDGVVVVSRVIVCDLVINPITIITESLQ